MSHNQNYIKYLKIIAYKSVERDFHLIIMMRPLCSEQITIYDDLMSFQREHFFPIFKAHHITSYDSKEKLFVIHMKDVGFYDAKEL